MARAVVGGSHAAVRAGDLDVEVGIADLLTDHLAHPHGAERRVGDDIRKLAAGGKAGGDARAVLLSDADVDMLLGQFLHELRGLAGLADIDVHHQNVLILFAQLDDSLAKAVTGRFFHDFTHCCIPLT